MTPSRKRGGEPWREAYEAFVEHDAHGPAYKGACRASKRCAVNNIPEANVSAFYFVLGYITARAKYAPKHPREARRGGGG